MDQANPPPRSRRRRALSVRTLMGLVLAIGTPLGWWVGQGHLQKRAVEAIKAKHGSVVYNEEVTSRIEAARRAAIIQANRWAGGGQTGKAGLAISPTPLGGAPSWKLWLEQTLGVDYVENATKVTASGKGFDREFDLALLADLPKLTYLSLRHKPVGDDGLRHLAGLHRLQILLLEDTEVSDAGLVHLAGLSALEELGLTQNGSRITDEGLRSLGGLRSLRSLWVGGEAITDAGLKHLHRLPNLNELILVHSPNVTQSGVRDLRRQHPGLVLDRRP